MRLALLLLVAACSRQPCPKAPEPVAVVVPQPECRLPELPGAISPELSFPDAETVAMSRAHFAEIAGFVTALTDWVVAAHGCLEAGK
jgi:hypothetical protein